MKFSTKRAVRIAITVSGVWLGACGGGDGGRPGTQGPGVMGFPTAGFAGGAGAAGFGGGGAGFIAAGVGGVAGMDVVAGSGGGAGSGFAGGSGSGVIGGSGGSAGSDGMAGSGAVGGSGGSGGSGVIVPGTCCANGDCLCHGPDPAALTSSKGTYTPKTFTISKGTVHYPENAEAPFAALALCGGFTNTGPEMTPWGEFYASHGIVTVITTTLGSDSPDIRATKLLAALDELKGENTKSGSPLFGKLAGRYGTSGYSMGGGGTTLASQDDPSLRTSIGLAAWGGVGAGIEVPTLLLCGTSDTTAACNMSKSAYDAIPGTTPKMMISINGASHLNWFGPTSAGGGTSGQYALAFQKVFLEGDERWKSLLLGKPSNGTTTTNIQ